MITLEPTTTCCICNLPTDFIYDKNKNYYCEEHLNILDDRELPILFNTLVSDYLVSKRRFNITSLKDIINRVENETVAISMMNMLEHYVSTYSSENPNLTIENINLENFNIYLSFFMFNLEANTELFPHRYLEHEVVTINNKEVYIITFDMRELRFIDSKCIFTDTRNILHFFCDNKDFALNLINNKIKNSK